MKLRHSVSAKMSISPLGYVLDVAYLRELTFVAIEASIETRRLILNF